MKTASMTNLRAHFGDYIKASGRAPIVVTRKGKAVAALIAIKDADEVERFMMGNSPRLQEILDSAEKRIAAGQGIPSSQFWKEVAVETALKTGKARKTA